MSKAGFDPSSSQRRGEQTQTHTSRMPRRSRTIWVLRVKHVAANSILRRMAPGVLAKNAIRVAIDLNGRLRATRRRALQGTDPRGTLAFRRRHQPRQAQSCRSTRGTLERVELLSEAGSTRRGLITRRSLVRVQPRLPEGKTEAFEPRFRFV